MRNFNVTMVHADGTYVFFQRCSENRTDVFAEIVDKVAGWQRKNTVIAVFLRDTHSLLAERYENNGGILIRVPLFLGEALAALRLG